MLSEGWGLLVATSGDFSWPPAGTSSGRQWGLFHGHGHTLRRLADAFEAFNAIDTPSAFFDPEGLREVAANAKRADDDQQ